MLNLFFNDLRYGLTIYDNTSENLIIMLWSTKYTFFTPIFLKNSVNFSKQEKCGLTTVGFASKPDRGQATFFLFRKIYAIFQKNWRKKRIFCRPQHNY